MVKLNSVNVSSTLSDRVMSYFLKLTLGCGAIALAPDNLSEMCVTSEFPVYEVNSDLSSRDYIKLLSGHGFF